MEFTRNRLAALLEREAAPIARTMACWLGADPSLQAGGARKDAWWERRSRVLLRHFTLWLQGWSPQGPERVRTMLAPTRVPHIFRSCILETLDERGALSREERSEAGRLIDLFLGRDDPAMRAAPGADAGHNAPRSPRR